MLKRLITDSFRHRPRRRSIQRNNSTAPEALESKYLLSSVCVEGHNFDSCEYEHEHEHEYEHEHEHEHEHEYEHEHNYEELHLIDASGNEWYAIPEAAENAQTIGGGTNPGGNPPFPYSQTFALNSNPGASHTIYLDFDGHTTSGTAWNSNFNGGSNFTTPAYSTDQTAAFSNSELANIQKIWQRVTEDFVPFDVNVTTEEPSNIGDLVRSGTGDTRWGVRVVIGGSSYDWYGAGAGGVAYVGSYNWNTDTPTYVFPDQLASGFEKYVAEAASHEAGHTLGLRHDGTQSQGYYTGHGDGETGWAPIMGVGYYENLSQWSKGEYSGANRLEDDLAILTSQNGFGYRADDNGNTSGSATAATIVSPSFVDGAGVIETNSDVDVFSFTTGAGTVSVDVQEFEIGPNLDILAELYDSSGSLMVAANPADLLNAQLSTTVTAGTYYLHITGVGKGDPLGAGYTDYGSIGQYSFEATIVDPGGLPQLSPSNSSVTEGGQLGFVLSLSAPSETDVSVNYSTANGSAVSGSDYTGVSGTAIIVAGQVSTTVTVNTLQDTIFEGDETLSLNFSGVSGATLSSSQVTGTIVDDDSPPPPSISIADATVDEGRFYTKGKNRNTAQQTTMSFAVTLSSAASSAVTVNFTTSDNTATLSDSDYLANSGSVTFVAGETSRSIDVIILGDNIAESDETFTVTLSNPTLATLGDAVAVGTIRDDDSGGGGNGNGRGKKNRAPVAIDTTLITLPQQALSLWADDQDPETNWIASSSMVSSRESHVDQGSESLDWRSQLSPNQPATLIGVFREVNEVLTELDSAVVALLEHSGRLSQNRPPSTTVAPHAEQSDSAAENETEKAEAEVDTEVNDALPQAADRDI